MRGQFLKLMYDLRASYWFVPSIMAFMAMVLGAVMVWLDAGPGAGLLDGLGWYQKAKPDGAHEVLSTIAGSMITVAGVVFSITIVAIAYAASQYGPRILTNFMSDRGNQITLGTFIATFVYCLVVLRTIRGGDEGEFVPQLAVMLGLLLALCSIAVLIFFIHHVPRSIHINNVVAQIGKQLLRSVKERFPEQLGDPPGGGNEDGRRMDQAGTAYATQITSAADGYIEAVDEETLMEAATKGDLKVRLHRQPGDFTLCGRPLMTVWPACEIDEKDRRALEQSFTIGNSRTPAQDMFFLVDELVEIAARALSPGVNDPYTAITCVDWLTAAAAELSRRKIPSPARVDENGDVRIIAIPESFADFIERGFGRMRQYLAGDMNAAAHTFDCLAAAGSACEVSSCKRTVGAEAHRLLMLVNEELRGPSLETAYEHYRAAVQRLGLEFGLNWSDRRFSLRGP